MKGILGSAAAAALIVGIPAVAFAGKSPPPPTAPAPADLSTGGAGPHWFEDFGLNSNPTPPNFFANPSSPPQAIGVTQATLTTSANASKPLGIIVQSASTSGSGSGLTTSDAATLFNAQYGTGQKAISYVFGDMETGTDANYQTNATTLVSQVRGSTWSKNAYVGAFYITPLATSDDHSYRGAPPGPNASHHHNTGKPLYDTIGLNMANTALYPGAYDMRNTSTGDWQNANIRTGLFIAPIMRMKGVQDVLNTSYNGLSTNVGLTYHKQIPYVARFNNSGNTSLDTDGISANGYQFVTANQLPSRGDFSAQILHYRYRGAYSVHALEPGVVGYTQTQMQDDIRDGWFGNSLLSRTNNIFTKTDDKTATMTLNPVIDGTSSNAGDRSEQTGTIWSGRYSLSLKQLDVLASNLDTNGHWIKFGTVDAYDVFAFRGADIGGSRTTYSDNASLNESRNALIAAGVHRLLQFDLVSARVYNSSTLTGSYKTQTIWLLNANYAIFTDNNRNGTGIPEPTSVGMLAAAGTMGLVCRRRRARA